MVMINCEIAEFCHFEYCKINVHHQAFYFKLYLNNLTQFKFQLKKLAFDWNFSPL